MGFDNIIAGDGIGLAITGMIIVFAGLTFISLYITALPRLADAVAAWRQRQAAPVDEPVLEEADPFDDPALRAAIGLVIEMELANEQTLDDQRITIQRDDAQGAWAFAGKMRTLSTRM